MLDVAIFSNVGEQTLIVDLQIVLKERNNYFSFKPSRFPPNDMELQKKFQYRIQIKQLKWSRTWMKRQTAKITKASSPKDSGFEAIIQKIFIKISSQIQIESSALLFSVILQKNKIILFGWLHTSSCRDNALPTEDFFRPKKQFFFFFNFFCSSSSSFDLCGFAHN